MYQYGSVLDERDRFLIDLSEYLNVTDRSKQFAGENRATGCAAACDNPVCDANGCRLRFRNARATGVRRRWDCRVGNGCR